ncbi:alpha-2-macroglobulin family protein, partial [Hymenobacter agri]
TRVLLRAGQPAELVVTVDVKAAARYVLLEVPIPAGCSYGDPAAPNYIETHREYLRHQTGIFIDELPVGRHEFRIALQPRFRGQYTINPARAELVYFPTKFGRSASKQAIVR